MEVILHQAKAENLDFVVMFSIDLIFTVDVSVSRI